MLGQANEKTLIQNNMSVEHEFFAGYEFCLDVLK